MTRSEAELAARSKEADCIIENLKIQIEEIKSAAPLPQNIQETILKQENAQLRKIVESLKTELTSLELRNGKIQVQLPKPEKQQKSKKVEKPKEKPKEEKKKENVEKKSEKKAKTPKAAPAAAPADSKPVDVSRLKMKIGKIIECVKHPDADALYLEKIECGEEQPRQVISGLVKHIPIGEMQNRMVIILCNLKPAKMRGIMSEAMVMCASTPEKVEILTPPNNAAPGDIVTVPGFEGEPDELIKPTNKKNISIFEQVAPDLKTNDEGLACYKNVAWEVKGKGAVRSQSLKNVQVK
jgi:aminoacyl tRNA synthase complex-interacting multifunctional protein 1